MVGIRQCALHHILVIYADLKICCRSSILPPCKLFFVFIMNCSPISLHLKAFIKIFRRASLTWLNCSSVSNVLTVSMSRYSCSFEKASTNWGEFCKMVNGRFLPFLKKTGLKSHPVNAWNPGRAWHKFCPNVSYSFVTLINLSEFL